jgi:hypothetical protein
MQFALSEDQKGVVRRTGDGSSRTCGGQLRLAPDPLRRQATATASTDKAK